MSNKLQAIHALAKTRIDEIRGSQKQERELCLEDRRFARVPGAMWEGAVGDLFKNKFMPEINKVYRSVVEIQTENRSQATTVNFVSKDGTDADETADTCDALFRADEKDSTASEAYDNAFSEGVSGGIGAWRLRNEYEDEYDDEDTRQRIRFEPIFDADLSVFWDLNAKRYDKADAGYCFVLTSMTPEAFESEYDESVADWGKTLNTGNFDWCTPDVVYVVEYFLIEEETVTCAIYSVLEGDTEKYILEETSDKKLAELAAVGSREISRKRVKRRKVMKYTLSAREVLGEPETIPGPNIPVIPYYGDRSYIENIERVMGHVRLAKDPQRIKNMVVARVGEIASLSPVEKPIVTPEQMAGHQDMWSNDVTKNFPYLFLNPVEDAEGNTVPSGPIAYTKPPDVPPSLAALLTISDTDIDNILGSNRGDDLRSNISGDVVEQVQSKQDRPTAIYSQNFEKSVRRNGEVWLGMAREIYVEDGRKMKGIGASGEKSSIEINQKTMSDTGAQRVINDISAAKYDVDVDTGPRSDTKRQAVVRRIMETLPLLQDPQERSIMVALLFQNLEGEGLGDIREFYRKKLVRMKVLEPTEEDEKEIAKEQENVKPDANEEFLKSEADKNRADAVKKTAETEDVIAKTAKTEAETVLLEEEARNPKPAAS